MKRSTAIRRRRLIYAIPGFIIGFGLAAIIDWLVGRRFAVVDSIMAGAGCASIALSFGQKYRGLPTEDDLTIIRLREEMNPLDLRSLNSVPVTLRTETERRFKL